MLRTRIFAIGAQLRSVNAALNVDSRTPRSQILLTICNVISCSALSAKSRERLLFWNRPSAAALRPASGGI
jgi:hypothetical protein